MSSYCIYVVWDDYRLTDKAILIAGKNVFQNKLHAIIGYLDIRIFYHQHNYVKAYLVYSRINCNHIKFFLLLSIYYILWLLGYKLDIYKSTFNMALLQY